MTMTKVSMIIWNTFVNTKLECQVGGKYDNKHDWPRLGHFIILELLHAVTMLSILHIMISFEH